MFWFCTHRIQMERSNCSIAQKGWCSLQSSKTIPGFLNTLDKGAAAVYTGPLAALEYDEAGIVTVVNVV